MGLFGFGKNRNKIIDLSEGYKRQQEKLREKKIQSSKEEDGSFLGNLADSGSQTEDDSDLSAEEKRKRLAKRLMDMTDKIEELSNQIYHLQQRIEVLERKSGVKSFE